VILNPGSAEPARVPSQFFRPEFQQQFASLPKVFGTPIFAGIYISPNARRADRCSESFDTVKNATEGVWNNYVRNDSM
jgi:hypothetical protein